MKNPKKVDLRIDVDAIHKGCAASIKYAKNLRKHVFDSDSEFQGFYGLKSGSPVMKAVCGS